MWVIFLVLLVVFILAAISGYEPPVEVQKWHQRGPRILDTDEVAEAVEQLWKNAPPGNLPVHVNGLLLPESALATHQTLCATTRGGKTVAIRLFLQSIAPSIYPGSNRRLLVYDGKGELLPVLWGMGIECPITSLDPMRSPVGWNIARDITQPRQGQDLALTLAPDEREPQKYWPLTAQRFISAVIRILVLFAPGQWNFEDVLLILRDQKLLKRTLRLSDSTSQLVDKYFRNQVTIRNTLTTIDSLVARYEPVAAAWARSLERGEGLSLGDWMNTSSCLMLGTNQDIKRALDPFNRVIFARLAQLLLAGPDVARLPLESRPRTIVALDEASEAGKLEGVSDLLLKGASKGVHSLIAFQDLPQIRQHYNKDRDQIEGLLGQCRNAFLGPISDVPTATWATGRMGKAEFLVKKPSVSESVQDGKRTKTRSFTLDHVTEDIVTTGDFQNLQIPDQNEGYLAAYAITEGIGRHRVSIRLADFLQEPKDPPAFQRDDSDFVLRDRFDDDDLFRLGIHPKHPKKPAAPQSPPTRQQAKSPSQDSLRHLHRLKKSQ